MRKPLQFRLIARLTRSIYLAVLLAGWLAGFNALAEENWILQDNVDPSVQLWTDDSRPPFRRVRAETTIAVPILPLLSLLQDPSTQSDWLPYTQRVEVLQKPTPTQTLVRFETIARWPFAARDAVTLFQVSQLDATHLHIDMLNQPDAVATQSGIERIPEAEGYWLLEALDQCRTRLRYEAGSRWGGNVPQWLVNRMNARLAREALQNLRDWAPAHYRDYAKPDYLNDVTLHAQCN